METTKQLINRAIIELGFNLESINYDYCNVIQSCGISNNMPTLHKTKKGDTKLYGNVNIEIHKVGDLEINFIVSIGVNTKKKNCRNWEFKHCTIIPSHILDDKDLVNLREYIWNEVRIHKNIREKL